MLKNEIEFWHLSGYLTINCISAYILYKNSCFNFFYYHTPKFFDHAVKYHHEKLRLCGYHEFYRATSVHKGVPLYIVSLWNTTILGVAAFMQHYYGPNFALKCIEGFFSPIVYITIFCATETFIMAIIHGSYISTKHFLKTAFKIETILKFIRYFISSCCPF